MSDRVESLGDPSLDIRNNLSTRLSYSRADLLLQISGQYSASCPDRLEGAVERLSPSAEALSGLCEVFASLPLIWAEALLHSCSSRLGGGAEGTALHIPPLAHPEDVFMI